MNRHPSELHAFALGDLTGAAEAAVARHVAACRRCRAEVRRLRAEHAATVDALPPVAPAPAARERALAAARVAMAHTASNATEPASRGYPRARPWTHASRRSDAPALAALALAAIVAVVAVVVSWDRHAAWRATEAERTVVAAWLTRDDVTNWRLPAAAGARSPGTVMVADDGVVLVVMRSPAPAGAHYRAWGVSPAGTVALGDVPGTVLRVPAAGYDAVVVSLEASRASVAPTESLGSAPLPRDPAAPDRTTP